MTGHFIDNIIYSLKKRPLTTNNTDLIRTDYGTIRVLDTGGNKPVIINTPDGPNVIEHHLQLIKDLSKRFRVICFEFPGIGFSYPNFKYDYSLDKATKLIINVMDILNVSKATLAFSCSNGFYAIKTAQCFPDRIQQLFLTQTPSLHAMNIWTQNAIPNSLKIPVIGQIANRFNEKKLAKLWYKYALPKHTDISGYQNKALKAFNAGSCFCLSSLVQGLKNDLHASLELKDIPTTLIWGKQDFTHKNTQSTSILDHIPECTIIEFDHCGHFPELENPHRYTKLIQEQFIN